MSQRWHRNWNWLSSPNLSRWRCSGHFRVLPRTSPLQDFLLFMSGNLKADILQLSSRVKRAPAPPQGKPECNSWSVQSRVGWSSSPWFCTFISAPELPVGGAEAFAAAAHTASLSTQPCPTLYLGTHPEDPLPTCTSLSLGGYHAQPCPHPPSGHSSWGHTSYMYISVSEWAFRETTQPVTQGAVARGVCPRGQRLKVPCSFGAVRGIRVLVAGESQCLCHTGFAMLSFLPVWTFRDRALWVGRWLSENNT